ncbi:hypothetical protein RJ641_026368, partial [Dillenia turbinata]
DEDNDSKVCLQDIDNEENYYESALLRKPQFRYLEEIGALCLVDDNDNPLCQREIYLKFMEQKIISWESYDAYKHLKSLGYIVGRHKFPWTLKNVYGTCESASSHDTTESNRLTETEYVNSLSEEFSNLQIRAAVPVFDVYLPNSKFKKSCPDELNFIVCLIRGNPPSVAEIRGLENHCSSIPLNFCHVDHGRVSFFSFAKVELPVLP